MSNRFQALHQSMQRHVDTELLAGVSSAVLVGRDLVDEHAVGWADRENRVPLNREHIFRVFSNTKLVTSCAAMLLWEQGRFGLDDPVDKYLPALANRQVLKAGATRIDETEPARSRITIRQLLSHSSGLSYGLLDPGTLMYQAYNAAQMLSPLLTLEQMVNGLAALPLASHPGTRWEYSVATDVMARLVEVLSGQRFDQFIDSHILQPLGMTDTAFVLAPEMHGRLTVAYAGANVLKPTQPGLTRLDPFPFPGAYLVPVPKLSGGHGLASTLPDMVKLIQSLLPGGPMLLKQDSMALLFSNQLADGQWLRFADGSPAAGRGHSVAGSLTVHPWSTDPSDAPGDLQWGGLAGTHWWISPRDNVAGLVMTQRNLGFWNPYWFEFKALMRQAVKA